MSKRYMHFCWNTENSFPHNLISRYCMLQGWLSFHCTIIAFLKHQTFPQSKSKIGPGFLRRFRPSSGYSKLIGQFRARWIFSLLKERAGKYHSVHIEVTWGKEHLALCCPDNKTGTFQYFLHLSSAITEGDQTALPWK